ncbi:hypothetical protein GCM10008090_19200 [Arenicella chitinivorans]|uniref:SMI1/KNR4 family protein n=1 Tax=Arenicella chitinivorans TaxID=1329800 RepID=A0A918VMZ4_9GAMM|nr:hypothetical protein [Arenicella chitinivorans]GHA09361.1 hypothetical protein GCM10008090_19200 [Arenicella chitinivorans]
MIEEIKKILADFTEEHYCMDVAEGVPIDMRNGDVNEEGWVEWKLVPSTVIESDLMELETRYSFRMPPTLKCYLMSYCHLLDQVHSNKHDGQLIFMCACPSSNPLKELTELIDAWYPITKAGYMPFAQWGDGWGPMCLDLQSKSSEPRDYNIVWFDHEELIPLGQETCTSRQSIVSLAKPLYQSFSEFFYDVYAKNA